jgi:6-pyruvoyltetrahydropterin/6-carboxytetrahydropterin synthase
MVYDFGLMKGSIKAIIDSFDHAITLWSGDDSGYIKDMKKHSSRWIELGVSPSAEQFSRVFFVLIDRLFAQTTTINGEKEVKLHSIIVHETDTGYAQAFRDDAYSSVMGEIELDKIIISEDILSEYGEVWQKLKSGEEFINPRRV